MKTIQEVMEKYHLTRKEYAQSEGGSYYTVENIEMAMADYADQFKVKNLVKPDVSGSLPTLEEVAHAKQKYADKKRDSGYSTGLDGVKSHWQDGVNWALNYVAKSTKQ